jgi:hypothetical protein
MTPWSDVVNPQFIGKQGVSNGWDWTLPNGLEPARRGLLTINRANGRRMAATLEALEPPTFAVNPMLDMWLDWKDFEAAEGEYDFSKLVEDVNTAASKGWGVGIRYLTSETDTAPEYLGPSGYNLSFKQKDGKNINYDPADPIFHARYLAFISALAETKLCQHESVKLVYVGYASSSNGDEGIGPHGQNPPPGGWGDPDSYPHVVERLDAFQKLCHGEEWKVIMGGYSAYGVSLGFGARTGYIEHYWYRIPDGVMGISKVSEDGYLEVDESASVFQPKLVAHGDENEEYEPAWSSDYRTNDPAGPSSRRGGRENSSAPEQGAAAGFGPLVSFPYRYLVSSLRTLQMRVSALLVNRFAVNPSLGTFLALELGRTAADTPDAWCFLIEGELKAIGKVKNFERWLYQRDTPDFTTMREAKITQTPAEPSSPTWMTSDKHDWIARSADSGVMNFQLDSNFLASPSHYTVKVTFWDVVGQGSIRVTNPDGGTLGSQQPTTGDGALKTATIIVDDMLNADSSAFQVRGFDSDDKAMEIVVSFVRVIKTP